MEFDGLQSTIMPPPAVTLTFDLSIPKANHYIYERIYNYDPNWVKFPSLFFEIWCLQSFRDAQNHALTHSLTDGQNPNTVCLRQCFQRWQRHKNGCTALGASMLRESYHRNAAPR